MNHFHGERCKASDLVAALVILASLLIGACATVPRENDGEVALSLCEGLGQVDAQRIAEDWLALKLEGQVFHILEWRALYDSEEIDKEVFGAAGCILRCKLRLDASRVTGRRDRNFIFLFKEGSLVSAQDVTPDITRWH